MRSFHPTRWNQSSSSSGTVSRSANLSRTGPKYWLTASLPLAVRSKPIPSVSAR